MIASPPPEPPAPPAPRAPRSRLRVALLALAALLGLYLFWEAVTWPKVAALAEENPGSTAFIDDYRGGFLGLGEEREVQWRWAPYERLSPNLKRAVVVAEDINFFSHDGFDRAELRKALEQAWEEREVPRGASTITQQVAKNLWLSSSRNPLRKVKEALLTRQLEKHLAKRRILEIYLNVVEFGPGIYGAEAASRHYWGRSAGSLTERQAAELAASLPRPKSWHPGVTSGGYQRRVRSIQRRMDRARWLRGEV